jgi:UDPglucose 6-dehydrogenase
MKPNDTISFIGLGKLGLPLASCIAESGKKVLCIDKNEYVLDKLVSGELPFYEPGLEELFSACRENFLGFSDCYKEVIEQTDTTVILVNTQMGDHGYSSEFVESALSDLAVNLKRSNKPYHTILLSSTVLPGEIKKKLIPLVERISGRKFGEGFGFAYVPDFVKLGSVIKDFKNPEFFLVGAETVKDYHVAQECFAGIHHNECRRFHLTLEETEIAKVALNAYIVEKISFANFLGYLCKDLPNVNVHSITDVIGLDRRISPYFFKSGAPYGGTCFPRDTQAYIKFASDQGLVATNLVFAEKVNECIQQYFIDELYELNKDQKVGILGVSFKADSPVTIGSPALPIIEAADRLGLEVNAYDKLCESQEKVWMHPEPQSCIDNSDIVFILHYDKEFSLLNYTDKCVIDPWGLIQ